MRSNQKRNESFAKTGKHKSAAVLFKNPPFSLPLTIHPSNNNERYSSLYLISNAGLVNVPVIEREDVLGISLKSLIGALLIPLVIAFAAVLLPSLGEPQQSMEHKVSVAGGKMPALKITFVQESEISVGEDAFQSPLEVSAEKLRGYFLTPQQQTHFVESIAESLRIPLGFFPPSVLEMLASLIKQRPVLKESKEVELNEHLITSVGEATSVLKRKTSCALGNNVKEPLPPLIKGKKMEGVIGQKADIFSPLLDFSTPSNLTCGQSVCNPASARDIEENEGIREKIISKFGDPQRLVHVQDKARFLLAYCCYWLAAKGATASMTVYEKFFVATDAEEDLLTRINGENRYEHTPCLFTRDEIEREDILKSYLSSLFSSRPDERSFLLFDLGKVSESALPNEDDRIEVLDALYSGYAKVRVRSDEILPRDEEIIF